MSKLKTQLLTELSKANTLLVADYIGYSREKLTELWKIIIEEKSPLPERASWALNKLLEQHPEFQETVYNLIMDHFEEITLEPVLRNVLRILSMQTVYKEKDVPILLDKTFDYMMSTNKPVAIKVYSMQILYNISQVEKDIKQELIYAIEEDLPKNSVGFKSRGTRIIKKLKRELNLKNIR